jgi:uncharacterized protein YcbX
VRVLELWRYPVKSLQGEQLDSVAVMVGLAWATGWNERTDGE